MLDKIRLIRKYPHVIPRHINRLYHSRLGTQPYNANGINIIKQDWDRLIILDACRYDVFVDQNDLPGTTRKVQSRAGTTTEFLESNFSDKNHHDTIYVSSNSWFFQLKDELGTEFFQSQFTESDREAVDTAIELSKEHPNKRLITHLVNPHHPYRGETAERLFTDQGHHLFDKMTAGDHNATTAELRVAYEETLEYGLDLVIELFKSFSGRMVVTADHGELLGDKVGPIPMVDYGHYSKYWVDPLVIVPWHVYETGERPIISSDSPITQEKISDKMVEDRLEALGYR